MTEAIIAIARNARENNASTMKNDSILTRSSPVGVIPCSISRAMDSTIVTANATTNMAIEPMILPLMIESLNSGRTSNCLREPVSYLLRDQVEAYGDG